MTRFLRNVLLPPPYAEQLTAAQWRTSNTIRLVFALSALGIDVLLWLGLRDNASISPAISSCTKRIRPRR